ncbi:MAG TPA: cation transporter, partial [Acidimicrobiales bacterium]|nr:cation transporter [Acidimicrobiales bacterium]
MSGPRQHGGAETSAVEATLLIEGMTCGACAARIERRLNHLDGVRASVSYAAESAHVALSSGDRLPDVLAAIGSLGYGATPVRTADAGTGDRGDADAAVRSLGRRLVVAGLLFMPLCDMSLLFWLMPDARFPGWQWLLTVTAAPVVTWCAWPFYAAAARHLRRGT